MYTVLLVIHTILVFFLIGMILIQRTESDGLGGLGGGGGNQFLTGRSAANLLTRTTAILAALFMITSLTLGVISSRSTTRSILDAAPATDISDPASQAAAQSGEPTEAEKAQQNAPVRAQEPSVPKPE